eukprot:jgi/Mesen1/581/ME000107S10814
MGSRGGGRGRGGGLQSQRRVGGLSAALEVADEGREGPGGQLSVTPENGSEGFVHSQSNHLYRGNDAGIGGDAELSLRVPGGGRRRPGQRHDDFLGTTPPSGSSGRGQSSQSNANHLLNFHFAPIQRASGRSPAYLRRQRGSSQPFNKELFLQANFRFLVSDLGDYALNASEADRMLDWHDVAAVEISATAPPQCPICLEQPPLCPQITSCGHLFCFPCILRYLLGPLGCGAGGSGVAERRSRGDHWKKCPLCFAMTSARDLRSVTVHVAPPPVAGDLMRFSLLVRSKASIIPFQRSALGATGAGAAALAYSHNGQCHSFSKFTLTAGDGVDAVVQLASSELATWEEQARAGGCSEELERIPYLHAAVEQLHARRQAWGDHRAAEFLSSSPPVQRRIMAQTRIGLPPVAAALGVAPDGAATAGAAAAGAGGAAKGGQLGAAYLKEGEDSTGGRDGQWEGAAGAGAVAGAGAGVGVEGSALSATDVALETQAAMARLREQA